MSESPEVRAAAERRRYHNEHCKGRGYEASECPYRRAPSYGESILDDCITLADAYLESREAVALPGPSALEGWRTMESAPKDCTDFLAYFDNGEQHVVNIRPNGKCYGLFDELADSKPWEMPLFWMPLPQSPTGATT